MLLEATPRDVEVDEIRRHIAACAGVRELHDLHVWTITSGVNVLSAHVVVAPDADHEAVLDDLQRCLSGDFAIEHLTFQLETEGRERAERASHR